MKRRKLIALLLACCMTLSLLTACGGDSGSSSTSSAVSQSGGESSETASSGEEASDGDLRTITILGVEGWSPFTDWSIVDEFGTYQVLQEWLHERNIDIECETVAAEQYEVVLQTRLASGQTLPDICKTHTMDTASLLALAKQGTIVPIEDCFDKYSDGTAKKTIEETYPNARPLMTAPDGHMYWFSNIQRKYMPPENESVDAQFAMMYRKDWADKLNIAAPTTLDEFTDMLRAFRDQDANGDGAANELANIGISDLRNTLAQCFGIPAGLIALDKDRKEVTSGWYGEHVKEYFDYLASLVQEGLVDPSANTDEIMAQNRFGATVNYPNFVTMEAACADLAPDANYVGLTPLKAIDGVEPGCVAEPGNLVWESYVVTKDCKDLEAIGALFDVVYSDEYGVLCPYGREGFEWVYDDSGAINCDEADLDANLDRRIACGALLWNGVLPRVQAVNDLNYLAPINEDKGAAFLALVEWPVQYPDGLQIEGLVAVPTDEEAERINTLKTNVETASSELSTKLALGQISTDQLEAEIQKMDEMGLRELIEIYNARYQRYLEIAG